MALNMTVSKSYALGGKTFAEQESLSGAAANVREVVIPAAQPGILTTRTSNTVGTLTMTNSGHGISTGNRIDIYWAGGVIRGATVGTVAGTSIPFTGGSFSQATVLPSASTAMVVGLCVTEPFSIVGNNLIGLAMFSDRQGVFVFADAVPNEQYAVVQSGDATAQAWHLGSSPLSVPNPLVGVTTTQVFMSHNYVTGPATMRVGVITS